MLIKRTNILFEEKTWNMLTILAEQKRVSAGQLVREAVKKSYFSQNQRMFKKQIFNKILSLRKKQRER